MSKVTINTKIKAKIFEIIHVKEFITPSYVLYPYEYETFDAGQRY